MRSRVAHGRTGFKESPRGRGSYSNAICYSVRPGAIMIC